MHPDLEPIRPTQESIDKEIASAPPGYEFHTNVDSSDSAAIAAYEAQGFKVVETAHDVYGTKMPTLSAIYKPANSK